MQALSVATQCQLARYGVLGAAPSEAVVWVCPTCARLCVDALSLVTANRALYDNQAMICTECRAAVCSACCRDCEPCQQFQPGDFGTRVCAACRGHLVQGFCRACIVYYSSETAWGYKHAQLEAVICKAKRLNV